MNLERAKVLKIREAEDSGKTPDVSRRFFLTGLGAFLGTLTVDRSGKALADTLTKVTEESRQPEQPRISFEILFTPHDYKNTQAVGIKEKMKSTDVFLPEFPDWNSKLEADFNSVSKGDMTPEEFVAARRWPLASMNTPVIQMYWAEINALHGTGVIVKSVDLPQGDALYGEIQRILADYSGPPRFGKDFTDTLKILHSTYQKLSDLEKRREVYMIEHLGALKDNIQKGQIPELKDKRDIKVLMHLGSSHTGIYHALRRKNENTQRTFPSVPHRYGYDDEITRRMMFDKKVDDTLLARDFLVSLMAARLFDHLASSNDQKAIRYERGVASKFDLQEIKHIHDAMKKSRNPYATFEAEFTTMLDRKKIRIAKTREEFEKMDF